MFFKKPLYTYKTFEYYQDSLCSMCYKKDTRSYWVNRLTGETICPKCFNIFHDKLNLNFRGLIGHSIDNDTDDKNICVSVENNHLYMSDGSIYRLNLIRIK